MIPHFLLAFVTIPAHAVTVNRSDYMPPQITPFQIHQQLLTDCHRLGRFSVCQLLLHRNAAVPWFILVPETDITDLLELPAPTRETVMTECAAIGRFIRLELGYPKVNIAAIGNMVPQLHVHVVGRRPADPCWPAPVWGHIRVVEAYAESAVQAITASLERNYSLTLMAEVEQQPKEMGPAGLEPATRRL